MYNNYTQKPKNLSEIKNKYAQEKIEKKYGKTQNYYLWVRKS